MKKIKYFFITLITMGSLSALAYFPVGECFNSQMNFGLGASMGFGAGGLGGAGNFGANGCAGCGGGFGYSGNTNYLLNSYVPTSVQMANPYGMSQGMLAGQYGVGANARFNPYSMNPGLMNGGANARVGLNLGQYTPLVMGLLTGGVNVGVGVGASAGMNSGGIYNGMRNNGYPLYGRQPGYQMPMNQPFYGRRY